MYKYDEVIRNIPQMPVGIVGKIISEGENHLLYIKDSDGKWYQNFNINWLENDPEQVDWLAQVLGRMFQELFLLGRNSAKKEIYDQLSGFVKLFEAAQNV